MFDRNYIRIICRIIFGLACVIAALLVIFGCVMIVDDSVGFGVVMIVAGLITPVTTTISLYPLFALSSIESNTAELEEKLDKIVELLKASATEASQPNEPHSSSHVSIMDIIKERNNVKRMSADSVSIKKDTISDAMNFINKKYNIHLVDSDNLLAIKEKTANISDADKSVQTLKKRISEAETLDEAVSLLKMHYIVHS